MRNTLGALVLLTLSVSISADEPTLKVGATMFADATYQAAPTTVDVDGNEINGNAFNVSRAYINLTGTLSKRFAFRVTSDIARETGSGSSFSGSQQFRLKYAYAQLNLDEWATKGSFVRFGMQQTPYMDYVEQHYRYRFQGPVFADREGYLSSSDVGVSARYVFPSDYGDVHAGVYNGEGYNKPEANDQKAMQIRATVRPLYSARDFGQPFSTTATTTWKARFASASSRSSPMSIRGSMPGSRHFQQRTVHPFRSRHSTAAAGPRS
jgi:hypothetical protein